MQEFKLLSDIQVGNCPNALSSRLTCEDNMMQKNENLSSSAASCTHLIFAGVSNCTLSKRLFLFKAIGTANLFPIKGSLSETNRLLFKIPTLVTMPYKSRRRIYIVPLSFFVIMQISTRVELASDHTSFGI